jgi:hypothetical protein
LRRMTKWPNNFSSASDGYLKAIKSLLFFPFIEA